MSRPATLTTVASSADSLFFAARRRSVICLEAYRSCPPRPRQCNVLHSSKGDAAMPDQAIEPAPLASRAEYLRHLGRNAAIFVGSIAISLGLGAIGYHEFERLPWLDATLNASMMLAGMGPLNPLTTTAGKVFGIVYALFSGVVFLSLVAVLLAPVLPRLLHRLHIDLYSDAADS